MLKKKNSFSKAERSRLLKIFLESKTIGFQNNYDKEFMFAMYRKNYKEFEELEKSTHAKVRAYYLNGGRWD